jgi:hypothetical protein
VLEAGVGLELVMDDRLKLTFDLDAQLSEHYSGLAASGRLGFEF